MESSKISERTLGFIYGLLAFTAWGFLPLYWKMLNQIPAGEILAHRVLWSFVFVTGIIMGLKKLDSLKQYLLEKKKLGAIVICSLLISINWFTFIWAVNSNYVIEASMGYYILPIVSVFLGVAFLKERITLWQCLAVGMALIGILIITVEYGRVPWVALVLAVSFGLYGLAKKLLKAEPLFGLALETAIITPAALGYIIFKQFQGLGALGEGSLAVTILLIGAGIATATPLLWFAESAKRIELSTIGFMEYIGPTISLFLGIFVFKEDFTKIHFISFTFIWIAIAIYSFAKYSAFRRIEQLQSKDKVLQS